MSQGPLFLSMEAGPLTDRAWERLQKKRGEARKLRLSFTFGFDRKTYFFLVELPYLPDSPKSYL